MRFYGEFGENHEYKQIFIDRLTVQDYAFFNEWIIFANLNPVKCNPSESCNCLRWEYCITDSGILEADDYFKITSITNGKVRLEGLIQINLDHNKDIIIIEGLEVAPWNRTLYCGEKRDFRYLGLILLSYAILYGNSKGIYGTMMLESLEPRENYYRLGLGMGEYPKGVFYFTSSQCSDFVQNIKNREFLILERGDVYEVQLWKSLT